MYFESDGTHIGICHTIAFFTRICHWLFFLQGILSDLFPGVSLPEHDYGVLQSYIENTIIEKDLQLVSPQVQYYLLART